MQYKQPVYFTLKLVGNMQVFFNNICSWLVGFFYFRVIHAVCPTLVWSQGTKITIATHFILIQEQRSVAHYETHETTKHPLKIGRRWRNHFPVLSRMMREGCGGKLFGMRWRCASPSRGELDGVSFNSTATGLRSSRVSQPR